MLCSEANPVGIIRLALSGRRRHDRLFADVMLHRGPAAEMFSTLTSRFLWRPARGEIHPQPAHISNRTLQADKLLPVHHSCCTADWTVRLTQQHSINIRHDHRITISATLRCGSTCSSFLEPSAQFFSQPCPTNLLSRTHPCCCSQQDCSSPL